MRLYPSLITLPALSVPPYKDYFEAEIQRSLSINFDIDSEYEQYLIMDDLKLYIANEYFSELETLVA